MLKTFLLALLTLALPDGLLAAGTVSKSDIQVTVGQDKSALITVEASKAPLNQVIDLIAEKVGVKAHYSALPQESVTATCAAANLESIMKCLLGPKAELVFRYPAHPPAGNSTSNPEELWILGSSLVKRPSGSDGECLANVEGTTGKSGKKAGKADAAEREAEIGRLLESSGQEDAGSRASSIAQLGTEGRIKDGRVRAAVERSLADSDPSVRIQAINALSQLGGADAAGVLQQALHDEDPNVRLMAVDRAGTDNYGIELLRSATSDRDEAVRELAAMKLQSAASH